MPKMAEGFNIVHIQTIQLGIAKIALWNFKAFNKYSSNLVDMKAASWLLMIIIINYYDSVLRLPEHRHQLYYIWKMLHIFF